MSDGVPSRRGARRRLTIRMRLTLSSAGLLTGAGAVLIALVYLYMKVVPSYQIVPDEGSTRLEDTLVGPAQPTTSIAITTANDFLDNLLIASLLALFAMAVLGGAAGWVVAGRIVRPLSEIGSAARRAASGALDHRVGLSGARDEVRDLADTFDEMLASLERSFAAQRRFTANASHELQSPLATIKTMIQVIEPDADADAYRALVARIDEVNGGNIDTVDALLELAAAENSPVDRAPLDLTALVNAIVAEHAADAQAARVELECSGRVGDVVGNVVLVRQALSNLVRNAIRHNHVGGRATLRVTEAPGVARIAIVNTGPIVAADDLAVLTEPFVRGGGRGLTRGSGHGLGLAIVRAALDASGGALDLVANHDGGLTATVELPLHAPHGVAGET